MIDSGALLQNRYEVIKPIGKGGMGAVYLARDQRLGNTVALKETLFTDTLMLAAFEREARLLAGLRHTALPKVMDHFADGHGQFLVMEFIPGEDLQDWLQECNGSIQVDEILQWADQILDALDYLHSQSPPVIHRDIKPQNLKRSSRNQVVLLDFGLAKNTESNTTVTNSGKSIFAYTPNYAPLEQIQGAGTDSQSDIYSLGATLYHLLTGVRPIDALTRASAIVNGKGDPLTSASALNPQIPAAVSEVLAQAMALQRDQRPATAIVMRRMLRNAVQTEARNWATEDQTVLTKSGSERAARSEMLPAADSSFDATRNLASTPVTRNQATPLTSPNVARQANSPQRAATPQARPQSNSGQPKTVAQSPWPTTPLTTPRRESSSQGKFIALAAVVVVVAVILLALNQKASTSAGETGATKVGQSEPEKNSNQATGGAMTSPTSSEVQYVMPAPTAAPERGATSESPSPTATATETTPKTEDQEVAQKPPSTEARQEPEKTNTPQNQPADRPNDPGREPNREPDRRPPPPPPGAYPPPHHGPPPPHGMPPPRRRP